jgi:hypothetical protein
VTHEHQAAYDRGQSDALRENDLPSLWRSGPGDIAICREALIANVLGVILRLPEGETRDGLEDWYWAARGARAAYLAGNYPAIVTESAARDALAADLEAAESDPRLDALTARVEAACDQIVARCRDAGVACSAPEAWTRGFLEKMIEIRREAVGL